MNFNYFLCLTLLLLFQYATVDAQKTLLIRSANMPATDTVLIYRPSGYTTRHAYPLLYLLHGYPENHRQWSNIINLQQLSDQFGFVIACPEGFSSWYINSPYIQSSRPETFFFQELVPRMEREITIDHRNIFISGLSMGGFGALRYFLLHPDYFNTAGCTSGGVKLDYQLMHTASLRFFQNERVTEDLLFPLFLQLEDACRTMHIPATLISQPGAHTPAYWKNAIRQHLLYFKAHLQ